MAAALLPKSSHKHGQIFSWALFDFANSSFAVMVVAFAFPYFLDHKIATGGNGAFYMGIAMSVSMLLVAIISPALGAMADRSGRKKQYLAFYTLISVCATAGIAFLEPGWVIAAVLLFIFGNAGFEGGLVFYDAYLPELAPSGKVGWISGIGFALGYLGSAATLMLTQGPLMEGDFRVVFLLTAGFFLLFSLPLFLFLPQQTRASSRPTEGWIRFGIRQNLQTLRHIRQYKNVARFLLAFFLYNDGILTVIAFSTIFATNALHLQLSDLVLFFLMVQGVAVPGSLLFGKLADRKGPKLAISITLLLWIVVVVGAYLTPDKSMFYMLGALAGLGLGSSQACSRSFMALLTPEEHKVEFFGFYQGFCGKASAVIGPLLFGTLSSFSGERIAIASLAAFFIAGFILLQRVESPETSRAVLASL